jgi:hypothetical protein
MNSTTFRSGEVPGGRPDRAARSFRSLVGMALQDWGSPHSWHAIAELHANGCAATLAGTCRLAASRNRRKRALGLHIASQLRQGPSHRGVDYALDDTRALLLAGLDDRCQDVVQAAVYGLGHRPHPQALPRLVQLARHPDGEMRLAVAFAPGRQDGPEAIDTLVQLASDPAAAVRDWATFGLGSMRDTDAPALRAVLWTRLDDPDEDVQGEALVGLARRKDERIVPVLLKRLTLDCRVYELDAAEELADPRLLERLLMLRDLTDGQAGDGYWSRRLANAIAACGHPPAPPAAPAQPA